MASAFLWFFVEQRKHNLKHTDSSDLVMHEEIFADNSKLVQNSDAMLQGTLTKQEIASQ